MLNIIQVIYIKVKYLMGFFYSGKKEYVSDRDY